MRSVPTESWTAGDYRVEASVPLQVELELDDATEEEISDDSAMHEHQSVYRHFGATPDGR